MPHRNLSKRFPVMRKHRALQGNPRLPQLDFQRNHDLSIMPQETNVDGVVVDEQEWVGWLQAPVCIRIPTLRNRVDFPPPGMSQERTSCLDGQRALRMYIRR